jgi:hypothetical protein
MGKKMETFRKCFLLFLFVSLNRVFPQTPQVITISPTFNEIASSNRPEISATFNVSMDSSSFDEISFAVFAERSGYHSGKISYVDETKSVSFNSNDQFNAGERVTVMLSNKIKSQQGDSLNGFSWVFRIPSGTAPVDFYEAVEYGGGGWFMQCIDINNDNYPDIVTSSGVILLNDGNGIFNNYWLVQALTGEEAIVNDFNRDGNMDIFFYGVDGLIIGLGDGNGNFSYTTKPYWFYNFVSADLNSDGYPDIAGLKGATYIPPDSSTLNWSISFNDGNGNFIDTVMYQIGGGGRPECMITTDLDNDGDIDVVIASHPEVNPNGIFGINGFIVCNNDGKGVFSNFQLYPEYNYLSAFFPYYIYSSDYNNDALNDLVIISSGSGLVAINLGNGTFGYTETDVRFFWPPELASVISGGDIDGDGWIDIVISGYEWPPELQIPYYAVTINYDSYFAQTFEDIYKDTLPTGYILATDIVDLNGDRRQDIIHSGIGVYISFSKDTISSIAKDNYEPNNFYLFQNYPNPFNPSTKIQYAVGNRQFVSLKVYDILGRQVATLVNEEKPSGSYTIEFNAGELSSGIYFYQLQAGEFISTKKLVLLK